MADKYNDLKKKKNNRFDTFLCHNSKDKAEVMELFNDLLDVGILAWIDEKELVAGTSLIHEIESTIEQIPSSVIVLGDEGLGLFQKEEYKDLMHDRIYKNKKIIPVILKNTKTPLSQLQAHGFLKDTLSIDFRNDKTDNLGKLYKSIMGQDLICPKAFVAEVDPNNPLEAKRSELICFLRQFGIKNLPENSNFKDFGKIEKSIEDCLDQADIFVQILDKSRWRFPGINNCLVMTQLDCAIRKLEKEKIFLWCAPDQLEQIEIEDKDKKEIITGRFITGRFEDFKYKVRDEALSAMRVGKKSALKARTKLFVRRDKTDSELAVEIFRLLQQQYKKEPKLTIRYLREFENTEEREEYLKKMIKECSILIIVYAQSKAAWVEDEVDDSWSLQVEVRRDRLPILILKHPPEKTEWLQDEDISYIPYGEADDISKLIKKIDSILESANG